MSFHFFNHLLSVPGWIPTLGDARYLGCDRQQYDAAWCSFRLYRLRFCVAIHAAAEQMVVP